MNASSVEDALMQALVLWSTEGSQHEGVQLLSAIASTGDARAMHALGLAYFRGQGVEKDLDAARELQLAAATRGLPEALRELTLLLAQAPSRAEKEPARKKRDARYSTLLVNKTPPSITTEEIP